jgi:dihydrodipicolinate synthase/N-acetylneuraminate lyase
MTDREGLIEEIRESLNKMREAGSIDSLAVATSLADGYSLSVEEIRALVAKEADAAGISHL